VDEPIFAKKLRTWVYRGFPELGDFGGMGLGATVGQVVSHSEFLENSHKAAELVWLKMDKNAAANGAIMRTSILGCLDFTDTSKVVENTRRICKVTHYDSRCVSSCVLTTVAICRMLQGQAAKTDEDLKQLLQEALKIALPLCEEEYKEAFLSHVVKDSSQESLESLKLDESKAIGYTFKCMGSGVWGLLSKRNFKETLISLAKEGGDSDTNGAVCGALLGTKIGYSNLPKDWLAALKNKSWLDDKVVAFLKLLHLG